MRETEKHEVDMRRHEEQELSSKHLAHAKKKEVDQSNKEIMEQKEKERKRREQEKILAREHHEINERVYLEKKLAHIAHMRSHTPIGKSKLNTNK